MVVRDAIAIRSLGKIVESTALEQLAANQNMDPTILSEIYDEYADRKQVDQRRELQLDNNRNLHQADAERYGEELMALYEKARLRRGGDTERQVSDSAFAVFFIFLYSIGLHSLVESVGPVGPVCPFARWPVCLLARLPVGRLKIKSDRIAFCRAQRAQPANGLTG